MGTRPEIIKLYPIVQELKDRRHQDKYGVCFTGQHDDLARDLLKSLGIRPDYALNVMTPGQGLNRLAGRLLLALDKVFHRFRPSWVIAQGDTTSVWAAAIGAFHRRIRFAHVEAGLRTGDKDKPFPEEMNRILASRIADLHFAPTPTAKQNLLKEGVEERLIKVVGNTVVDALRLALERPDLLVIPEGLPLDDKRIVLVTLHRREIHGEVIRGLCRALVRAASEMPELRIVFPVHPNPDVRGSVYETMKTGHSVTQRIHLMEPLDYLSFISLMKRAWLIVTDSGGIQEEAPYLGKPVLIAREATERPECVMVGAARLTGTDPESLFEAIKRLHDKPEEYAKMTKQTNPFGDGRAAARILDHIFGFSLGDMDLHHALG